MHDSIINEYEAALGETIALLSSLTEKEINTVPFEGSWTAAQVGEHLRLAGTGMDGLLLEPTQPVHREADERAPGLKDMFLDFGIKMESPDFILPEDKEYDKDELVQALETEKAKTIAAARKATLEHEAPLPEGHPFKTNTKLEMVHFATYHTHRHNHQIKKIKEAL